MCNKRPFAVESGRMQAFLGGSARFQARESECRCTPLPRGGRSVAIKWLEIRWYGRVRPCNKRPFAAEYRRIQAFLGGSACARHIYYPPRANGAHARACSRTPFDHSAQGGVIALARTCARLQQNAGEYRRFWGVKGSEAQHWPDSFLKSQVRFYFFIMHITHDKSSLSTFSRRHPHTRLLRHTCSRRLPSTIY